MDEVTLAKSSYQLVLKDLGLEDDISFEGSENAFGRLEEWLTVRINHLLDHDFNGLLNALYRIDVSEKALKELMLEPDQSEIARELAKAIIERQKQKVITRLKYRS